MSQQAVFEPLEFKEVLTELLINPGLEPIVKNPKKAETIGGSPVTHGGGERAFAVIIWPKMFHNPDIRLTKKNGHLKLMIRNGGKLTLPAKKDQLKGKWTKLDGQNVGLFGVIPTIARDYRWAVKDTSKCHLFYARASD